MSINKNIMQDDNSLPRKKKNTSVPRKKKNILPPTKSKQKVQGVLQQSINDVIEQAFMRFYTAENTKRHKLKDLYHLDTIVEEYLQSYMILGYDINGEKVCITHAKTPAERDSLIEHLRTTFIGIMNGLD